MQRTRLLLTFLMCTVAIMLLVGCNILDSLVKDGGGNAPLSQFLNRTPENKNSDAVPVITTPQQESTVKLYFADQSGKQLIEVNRTIPKTLSLAKETINQWLLGPTDGAADSYPIVSPDTVLRSINIKNGIATVDLSKEFLQPYSNLAAETTLYGLVNTVAQFSTVQIVKIRVEGKEIKVYRGIDLNDLRFRNDLIGYSSGFLSQGESSELEDERQESKKALADADSPSSLNIFMN
jgi:germination protein M